MHDQPKRNSERHTLVRLTKIKDIEKILKATREKTTHNLQGNLYKVIH